MRTTPKPTTADAAAQASIGAAARELHLPTVRTEAVRLAEIADRERQTHLRYLAEVLAAEAGDRTERRRARRINDAKFPRLKRLADSGRASILGEAVHPIRELPPLQCAVVPRALHASKFAAHAVQKCRQSIDQVQVSLRIFLHRAHNLCIDHPLGK